MTPRVVSVRHEAEDRISVLYEGKPVGDVRLVDLRIVSSGNLPIASADFERPFSVELGAGARVLASEVARTSPPDLAPRLSVVDSRLTIDPLLLNPGDSLDVTALVSDLADSDRLDGRVAGISKFVNLASDVPPIRVRWTSVGATVSALVGAVLAAVTAVIGLPTSNRSDLRVQLRQGGSLCGQVLHIDSRTALVKQQGSGTLRTVPLDNIKAIMAIKDKSC